MKAACPWSICAGQGARTTNHPPQNIDRISELERPRSTNRHSRTPIFPILPILLGTVGRLHSYGGALSISTSLARTHSGKQCTGISGNSWDTPVAPPRCFAWSASRVKVVRRGIGEVHARNSGTPTCLETNSGTPTFLPPSWPGVPPGGGGNFLAWCNSKKATLVARVPPRR